ncbi:hypothetical protein Scep_004627 [Stephania cephalantha]|uniref:Uncharacterized protein n=1 Tax=Stephania cephalantha TaxID=152367 RepID=A0AAP0KST0_9MAGN
MIKKSQFGRSYFGGPSSSSKPGNEKIDDFLRTVWRLSSLIFDYPLFSTDLSLMRIRIPFAGVGDSSFLGSTGAPELPHQHHSTTQHQLNNTTLTLILLWHYSLIRTPNGVNHTPLESLLKDLQLPTKQPAHSLYNLPRKDYRAKHRGQCRLEKACQGVPDEEEDEEATKDWRGRSDPAEALKGGQRVATEILKTKAKAHVDTFKSIQTGL